MRELHLVGFTSDHSGMILAGRRGAKTGGYVLDLTPDVVEQIKRLVRVRDGDSARGSASSGSGRLESELTPREIQGRLRAGRSLSEVAAEAGVGVEWIERFAAPILAEREAVVARAGRMFVTTPAGEMSERSLFESVRRNLSGRGVHLAEDELQDCWSVGHLEGREWLVCLQVRIKGRDVEAQWVLSNSEGTLVARDAASAQLGIVAQRRPAAILATVQSPPEDIAPPGPRTGEPKDGPEDLSTAPAPVEPAEVSAAVEPDGVSAAVEPDGVSAAVEPDGVSAAVGPDGVSAAVEPAEEPGLVGSGPGSETDGSGRLFDSPEPGPATMGSSDPR